MIRPNETWNLNQLARYVRTGMERTAWLEEKVNRLGRRTAVEVHRIGHALYLARAKTKPTRQWGKWLAKHGIPKMTAWEAIRLYESAPEKEVAKLTIMEAKMKFGIYAEFMLDDTEPETAATKEANGQDVNPEQQLNLLYRRLRGAAEVVGELRLETELLYSTEVDEILQFCRQVVRAISNQRKQVPQPKREDTRPYLAYLRSL